MKKVILGSLLLSASLVSSQVLAQTTTSNPSGTYNTTPTGANGVNYSNTGTATGPSGTYNTTPTGPNGVNYSNTGTAGTTTTTTPTTKTTQSTTTTVPTNPNIKTTQSTTTKRRAATINSNTSVTTDPVNIQQNSKAYRDSRKERIQKRYEENTNQTN